MRWSTSLKKGETDASGIWKSVSPMIISVRMSHNKLLTE